MNPIRGGNTNIVLVDGTPTTQTTTPKEDPAQQCPLSKPLQQTCPQPQPQQPLQPLQSLPVLKMKKMKKTKKKKKSPVIQPLKKVRRELSETIKKIRDLPDEDYTRVRRKLAEKYSTNLNEMDMKFNPYTLRQLHISPRLAKQEQQQIGGRGGGGSGPLISKLVDAFDKQSKHMNILLAKAANKYKTKQSRSVLMRKLSIRNYNESKYSDYGSHCTSNWECSEDEEEEDTGSEESELVGQDMQKALNKGVKEHFEKSSPIDQKWAKKKSNMTNENPNLDILAQSLGFKDKSQLSIFNAMPPAQQEVVIQHGIEKGTIDKGDGEDLFQLVHESKMMKEETYEKPNEKLNKIMREELPKFGPPIEQWDEYGSIKIWENWTDEENRNFSNANVWNHAKDGWLRSNYLQLELIERKSKRVVFQPIKFTYGPRPVSINPKLWDWKRFKR